MFIIYIFWNFLDFFQTYNVWFILLWKNMNFLDFFLEICILYVLIKLYSTSNVFKQIFLLGSLLIQLSAILFLYQLEVYACFLLINELMICLFIFILLLYKGYPSFQKTPSFFHIFYLLGLNFLVLIFWYYIELFVYIIDWVNWYWVDFYNLLIYIVYNDLISPFYFFYCLYPDILLLIGFFLFIFSIIFIYLLFQNITQYNKQFYRVDNNTQDHTLKKPTVSFFRSNFNDF